MACITSSVASCNAINTVCNLTPPDIAGATAAFAARVRVPDRMPKPHAAPNRLVAMHDPQRFAESIGLRWVRSGELPCIRRRRAGKGFTYRHSEAGPICRGHPWRDRLDGLAIPPAWGDVWICADPDGHLQATGRDARGRKQYRYHDAWNERRRSFHDANLMHFARGLPRLRRHVSEVVAEAGASPERMHAAAVRVLDGTGARIGSQRALDAHGTRGLTTWTLDHASVDPRTGEVVVSFNGKGGADREVTFSDEEVLRALVAAAEHDEDRLFSWRQEDGTEGIVTGRSLNAYLQEHLGSTAHAHQFRAWRTTWMTLDGLRRGGARRGDVSGLLDVLAPIAEEHGHTTTVARAHYLHAAVEAAWLSKSGLPVEVEPEGHLPAPEAYALAVLQRLTIG